ncbi:MAG: sodium:solute symporter [Bacteroidales bacterium]|nr:sodium:solute symporter [Bacteroidales bacterium]
MGTLDYIVIVIYFVGLIAVSLMMSRRIRNSEDMFIAGRNSSWWLSGISSYMTIFSAGTFVVWGGVAYKSGLVAVVVALCVGVASLIVARWISGKWRQINIKSPGEYLTIRFGHTTVGFYTISGIITRAVHTATALYAVAIVMCALVEVPSDCVFASTGFPGDSAAGHLGIWWALLMLGAITLAYTIAGGFLAVLMTDVIQFGVLLSVVVFMIPLSLDAVGGIGNFIGEASAIPAFFSGTSPNYSWTWLMLWTILNVGMIGGDWPFVQRYISVPTVKDAKKSTYLIGFLYLVTPLIWYLPTMAYRLIEPGTGFDTAAMTYAGEHAYVEMSKLVLMQGMIGLMIAAMLSATLSNVSGILNVYANVYTYEIWGRKKRNLHCGEAKKIRIGRIFTLFFGVAIVLLAMLVPLVGGAEKVVVTLLTLVMCPLYIPSIWGLFSKRLSGNQLIWTMVATWTVSILSKLFVPSSVIHANICEALCGCVLPLFILTSIEVISAVRGKRQQGFDDLQSYQNPNTESIGENDKESVRSYSHMAISCFCITIGIIALLLVALLAAGDPKTLAVKSIVWWFIGSILATILAYMIYRKIERQQHECR